MKQSRSNDRVEMLKNKRWCVICVLVLLFFVHTASAFGQEVYKKREMRGVWIATVANIDWPANRRQSSEEKMHDLRGMIAKLKNMGFNTIFFQIRTECDALYQSKYEPWSYWLTGEQGTAPEPYFDPLLLAIHEAHAAGMELHAWFNPYRAVKNQNAYPASYKHVSKQHPDWLLTFKDYQLLNPGLPEVRQYVKDVVEDVISNYDVDGVHFDDYFYPYEPKVSDEDTAAFRLDSRGIGSIDDWRRDNINLLMKNLYAMITAKKPWIKFGISPFGIVENKYANTTGFESYKILYCDPLDWINNTYVDYILPQLYWEQDHARAPFTPLFRWWEKISHPALLWVGHFSSSFLGEKYNAKPNELMEQLKLVRQSGVSTGSVFFSAKSLINNARNIADSLAYRWYLYPTLQPIMPWKDTAPPPPVKNVKLDFKNDIVTIGWQKPVSANEKDKVTGYVVYRFYDHEPVNLSDSRAIVALLPENVTTYSETLYYRVNPMVYVVTTLDRLQNESSDNIPVVLEFK